MNLVKFENNRIKYVENFVSSRLLPVLIVAAIAVSIAIGINLSAPAAAPLAVAVISKILFSALFSLDLTLATMGLYIAFCIKLSDILDLHETTKKICEIYNYAESNQNIKFTVTQYLSRLQRSGFRASCCDYSTEYSNSTELGYKIELPEPSRSPKLYNKCIAICRISDIKCNFFNTKDLSDKKLVQYAELKSVFFWALPQIRTHFNLFMNECSRCEHKLTVR